MPPKKKGKNPPKPKNPPTLNTAVTTAGEQNKKTSKPEPIEEKPAEVKITEETGKVEEKHVEVKITEETGKVDLQPDKTDKEPEKTAEADLQSKNTEENAESVSLELFKPETNQEETANPKSVRFKLKDLLYKPKREVREKMTLVGEVPCSRASIIKDKLGVTTKGKCLFKEIEIPSAISEDVEETAPEADVNVPEELEIPKSTDTLFSPIIIKELMPQFEPEESEEEYEMDYASSNFEIPMPQFEPEKSEEEYEMDHASSNFEIPTPPPEVTQDEIDQARLLVEQFEQALGTTNVEETLQAVREMLEDVEDLGVEDREYVTQKVKEAYERAVMGYIDLKTPSSLLEKKKKRKKSKKKKAPVVHVIRRKPKKILREFQILQTPRVRKVPKMVFGERLPPEHDFRLNAFEWIYNYILKSAIDEEKEKKYRYHMRLPRRLTHPQCIPTYPFKPDLPSLRKQEEREKKKKKKKKETIVVPDKKAYHYKPSIIEEQYEYETNEVEEVPKVDLKKREEERQLWFEKNSRPKPVPEPRPITPPPHSGRFYTPQEWEAHLTEISKPRRINRKTPPPPHFNPKALEYKITPRVEELAKPRPFHPEYVKQYIDVDSEETKLKRARAYEPTDRILKLSEPRHITEKYRRVFTDPNADVWKVNPNSLEYKATKRIKRLAKPKEYPEEEYYDPYKVKPSALNYTMTPRMIELAAPKPRPQEYKHNCYPEMYGEKVVTNNLNYKITKRMLRLAKPKGDPRTFKHNCFPELYRDEN